MIYVVEYVYDPARRAELDELRPAHREFLRSLHDRGDLVASGPWLEGDPGALLLLRADDPGRALAALDADPFRLAGLVVGRTARAWNPVIGDLAA